MDSQYKEDRERFQEEKKNEEPVLAHGGDISKHLGKFVPFLLFYFSRSNISGLMARFKIVRAEILKHGE